MKYLQAEADLAQFVLDDPGLIDAMVESLLAIEPRLEPPPLRATIEQSLREMAEGR